MMIVLQVQINYMFVIAQHVGTVVQVVLGLFRLVQIELCFNFGAVDHLHLQGVVVVDLPTEQMEAIW
jgi:hypothetical protein